MKNAAELLADLFASWTVPSGQPPENVRRRDGDEGSIAFWRTQAQAVALVGEIERALDGLDHAGVDVEPYRADLHHWYEAAFAFQTPWNSTANGTRPALTESQLRMLRALGSHMRTQACAPEIDLEQLAASLTEIETLINGHAALADEDRRYLVSLVREARRYIEDIDLYGSATVRRVVYELATAAGRCAETGEDGKATPAWKHAVSALALSVGGQVVAGAALPYIHEGLRAITG